MKRYFVKNLGGRIVEVQDEEEFNKWLQQGFTIPTQEEIDNHIKLEQENYLLFQTKKEREALSAGTDGIYFATVTSGAKDGYGRSSIKLLDEMQKLGTKVSTMYTGQKVTLLYHTPYSLAHLQSPIKILYSMFESTKLPDEWKDYLKLADKILVPSTFCQAVFKDAGFASEVVPLGYDDTTYTPLMRDPVRDYFTFIHYDAFNVRKGFMEVFKAFVNEFKPTEPVKMIFKTTRHPAPLPIPPSVYPNIEVITGPVEDTEIAQLLSRSDCFVFPSRGEGFGVTPLEAMATGLPVIVPNAHGISEYFNHAFMYDVAIEKETPATYTAYKGQDVGKMVICSVDDLQKKMRYVYEHQEEARLKGISSGLYAKQYTLKQTAKTLKSILEEAQKLPFTEKKTDNVLPVIKV